MISLTKQHKHRILTFHRIVDDQTPTEMVSSLSGELMTQTSFKLLLEKLKRRFEFVSMTDFLASAQNAKTSLATISFDDGFADNYLNALPILDSLGLRATFFVISDMIGRTDGMPHHRLARSVAGGKISLPEETRISPALAQTFTERELGSHASDRFLTRQELKSLVAAGMSIQSHGVTHTPLSDLETVDIEDELSVSKSTLEQITNQQVKFFAYPIGRRKDFPRAAEKSVCEAGYEAAFSTIKEEWGTDINAYALPRWGMRDSSKRSLKTLRLGIWG